MKSIIKKSCCILLVLCFVLFGLSFGVVNADPTTAVWTASSGGLGIASGYEFDDNQGNTWTVNRPSVQYTGWTSNCIQLGKNGYAEDVTISTSDISGTITSVAVECASYQAKHSLTITVGDSTFLSATATPSWTSVGTLTGTGSAQGTVTLAFTKGSGSRALYVKSITVIYAADSSEYEIRFNANGGTFDTGKGETIVKAEGETENVTLPTASDLTQTAYTYSTLTGWTDGSSNYDPGEEVEVTDATTFTAIYAGTTVTIAQALEIADATGNTNTAVSFSTAGYVKSIDSEYNSTYNNITITLSDGLNDITCFGLSGGSDLAVADGIIVTGAIIKYNNTIPEFASTSTYVDSGVSYYQVTFDLDGGSFTDGNHNQILLSGAKVVEPTDPVKDGFTFVGWYKEAGYINEFDFDVDTITTTTIIYAKWNIAITFSSILADFSTTQTKAALKFSYTKYSASTRLTDTLDNEFIGTSGTSYKGFSDKTDATSAVYAGNSAGGNSAIQLRSTGNSGIITTTSGGKAKKIVVVWNSSTAADRVLDIYGKNTAYSATTNLYNNSEKGTKIGSIAYGTSTELVIDGEYEYIGIRSNSGALYLDSIQITWLVGGDTYGNIEDLEIQFTNECEFDDAFKSLVTETGLIIVAGNTYTFDNENPETTIPYVKYIKLVNSEYKNGYIGGLVIPEIDTYYDTNVTAISYIKDSSGNYYYNLSRTCSIESLVDIYMTEYPDTLIATLAEAIETQAYGG